MPDVRLRVFISSVQAEFAHERAELKAYLLGDPFLRRFIFDVFLFEEIPAQDRTPDDVYLSELARSDIYLGIFGYQYGFEDADGVSPTEHEFNFASNPANSITRFAYLWGRDESMRHPKMTALVKRLGGLIRRRVEDLTSLKAEVYASLVNHIDQLGGFATAPFDRSPCRDATLCNIAGKRVEWFLETAGRERGFPLRPGTTARELLTRLDLLDGSTPTHSAILLFGAQPQRFLRHSEVKCCHLHGIDYRRPFASQQNYEGDLFLLADQALDFVLAKINRPVGTRAAAATAPATYELPREAVAEAIINALVHRDYLSHASVEVRLFADRLEVWNPGTLPPGVTPENLAGDHPSIPVNVHLAEVLYLARYIEKSGTGTNEMIHRCREAGLPDPSFELRDGSVVTTLWRNWLTDEILKSLKISDRQIEAVHYLRNHHSISNREFQNLSGVSESTALRELNGLVEMGLLERTSTTGRATRYTLARKAFRNPSNPS